MDPLWAPAGVQVQDPRLLQLLESQAVLRLKGIGCNGPANYVDSPRAAAPPTTSRYDHSVGVMLLTRMAGGTVEEQICGLLHDLPHTCFSHTIDELVGRPRVSYHEEKKDELLRPFSAELAGILGPDWGRYLVSENFPAVKLNKLLAADAADYYARDAVAFGLRPAAEVRQAGARLRIAGAGGARRLCCASAAEARWWQDLGEAVAAHVYNSAWNAAQNILLAQALRRLVATQATTLAELQACLPVGKEAEIFAKARAKEPRLANFRSGGWRLVRPGAAVPPGWKRFAPSAQRTRVPKPVVLGAEAPSAEILARGGELEARLGGDFVLLERAAQEGGGRGRAAAGLLAGLAVALAVALVILVLAAARELLRRACGCSPCAPPQAPRTCLRQHRRPPPAPSGQRPGP